MTICDDLIIQFDPLPLSNDMYLTWSDEAFLHGTRWLDILCNEVLGNSYLFRRCYFSRRLRFATMGMKNKEIVKT